MLLDPSLDDAAHLPEILELLLRTTGIDFTGYKSSTLLRRVRRRMILRQSDGIAQYVDSLRQQAAEVAALCDDILIGVTSFFRNPPAFSALAEQVFPTLLQGRSQHDPVRIWVVGCSTGQEAYSLAIELTEAAERAGSPVRIQLFATDLNERAVETARRGVYPKDITEHVSPERLQRFFVESADGYRISKSIRDACVFSRHNLLVDPPFSRIDLVSCRNLLIYLEPSLQRRVIPILHYALRPDGYLWLGGAEALGAYRALFDTLDSKHKIYTKRGGNGRHVARAARRSQQPGGGDTADRHAHSRCARVSATGRRSPLAQPFRAARGGDFERSRNPAIPRRHRPLPDAGAGAGEPQSSEDAARRSAGVGARGHHFGG